jgi:hypothetical protein
MSNENSFVPGTGAAAAVGATETPTTKIVSLGEEQSPRGEVSAATIGRMLGLASVRELSLLDGKLDLMMSKVNHLTAKLERITSILGSAPTGKDLERIDVQIAALRTQLAEYAGKSAPAAESAAVAAAPRRPKIVSTEGEPAPDSNEQK